MNVATTRAVLLAHLEEREADRTVVAFTEDLGLVRVAARSSRAPSAKLGGVLEPFALSTITVAEGRARMRALGSVPEETFTALARTTVGYAAAHIIVEALLALTRERSHDPALFGESLHALRAMNESAGRRDAPALWWAVSIFLARLLAHSGVGVALDRCARCGAPVEHGAKWLSGHGGLVHRTHADGAGIAVPDEGIAALSALAQGVQTPPSGSLLPLVLVLREVQLNIGRELRSVRFAESTKALPLPKSLSRLLYSNR